MALTHMCSSILGEGPAKWGQCSLEDAQFAMKLYRFQSRQWEYIVVHGSYRFSSDY